MRRMRGARGIHRHTEEGPARVSGTFTDVRPEEHTVVGSQQQQQQTSRVESSGEDLTVEFAQLKTIGNITHWLPDGVLLQHVCHQQIFKVKLDAGTGPWIDPQDKRERGRSSSQSSPISSGASQHRLAAALRRCPSRDIIQPTQH